MNVGKITEAFDEPIARIRLLMHSPVSRKVSIDGRTEQHLKGQVRAEHVEICPLLAQENVVD